MKDYISLNETTSVAKFKIVESNDQKKNGVLSTIEGPFAEIESKNRNNRVYSKSLWESAINSDYIQEMLENKTLFGEADHPDDRFEISLPKISHAITDLWIDEQNNKLMGRVDVLDTPAGRILNTVVEYGSKIGISARAAGSLEETDEGYNKVVEEDYTLFTFDTVPNPGFETTRLDKVKNGESIAASWDVENMLNGDKEEEMKGKLVEEIENAKKENLDIIESLIGSLPLQEKNYKHLIDKIEEKRENQEQQEKNFSLLEEAYKKVVMLKEEKKSLQEKIESLEDEVNCLSEEDEEIEEGENQFEEMHQEILRLKRLVKSKELYADKLEERIKDISESKINEQKSKSSLNIKCKKLEDEIERLEDEKNKLEGDITEVVKRNEILENKLEDIKEKNKTSINEVREKYEELEKYVIEQIAGKTGVSEKVVRKYIPEDFDVDEISDIEKKIKEDFKRSNFKSFKSPFEVKKNELENIDEENEKNKKADEDLISLVGKLNNK